VNAYEIAEHLGVADLPLGKSRKVRLREDERTPSCNVTHTEDDMWLFFDHGVEMSWDEIIEAVENLDGGWNGNHDRPRVKVNRRRRSVEKTYDYCDEQGTVLYQVVRFEGKEFEQRQPDGTPNLKGIQKVLYNLPEVLEADEVWLVEGEKDADALITLGVCATTNAGGATSWEDDFTETLRGKHVVLGIDRDKSGMERGRRLIHELSHVVASLRIVEADSGKDAYDHLTAGGTLDSFRDVHYLPTFTGNEEPWPDELHEDAFYGVAGEFVRTVAPHSESDPAALLTQFLVCAGNAIGPNVGFEVESTFHGTNLYAVMVGDTSKARKGTSVRHVKRVVADADPSWIDCEVTGMSSGEGLIERVKDAEMEVEQEEGESRIKIKIGEDGAPDKRLMVFEEEFASVLAVCKRQGNTISPVVRQAWDHGRLQTLTKNNPAVATGAHISIIGHITTEELRRNFDGTEVVNGFGNRFLFACVRRSKVLPHGGRVTDDDLQSVVDRVRAVVSYVGSTRTLERDREANVLWEQEYERLSDGGYGLLGAVTSRAEAQVMRLACVYALLDQSRAIKVPHLRAALALWRYCEASCRYIFGDATGNPDADTILTALRSDYRGKTRHEISMLFARNRSKRDIDLALALLERQGRAAMHREKAEGRGRPTERWVVT
jgi:hypothetical protein